MFVLLRDFYDVTFMTCFFSEISLLSQKKNSKCEGEILWKLRRIRVPRWLISSLGVLIPGWVPPLPSASEGQHGTCLPPVPTAPLPGLSAGWEICIYTQHEHGDTFFTDSFVSTSKKYWKTESAGRKYIREPKMQCNVMTKRKLSHKPLFRK